MQNQETIDIKVASAFSSYTLEAKYVNTCMFRRITHIPLTKINEFTSMVARFIRKSGEWDATVQQTLDKISSLFKIKPDDVCFYIMEKDSKLIGYFYAEVLLGEYDEMGCHVHHVYVSPSARHFNLTAEIERILVDFARRRGALDLRFLTGRYSDAWIKKLSGDWKVDAVRLKRSV